VDDDQHGANHIPVRRYLAAIWLTIGSLLLLGLLYEIRRLLVYGVLALFLAVVLRGPVDWFSKRMRRGFAITLVSVRLFLGVSGVVAAIATPLAGQAANVAQHAPAYLSQAERGKGPIGRLAKRANPEGQLKRVVPAVSKNLSDLPRRMLDVGRGVASAGASTVIVLVLTVFMLVEGPAVIAAVERAVPDDRLPSVRRIGQHVAQTVSSYTVGIIGMAVLNGLVTAAALAVMRVPFVLPLAVWSGVVDILPIVGGLLAMVVVSLFAFSKSLIAGIVVIGAMLVYQQIKNHGLYPVVVGRAVRLNSLVVLLSVLAGAELFGVVGAMLAIPFAAVVHVVSSEFLGHRFPWVAQEPSSHDAAQEGAEGDSDGAASDPAPSAQ
jgi:predicted PurR-regulated permease PerM